MCVSITESYEFVRYEKVSSGVKIVEISKMITKPMKKRLPDPIMSVALSNFFFKSFCIDSLTKVSLTFLTCFAYPAEQRP